MGILSMKSVNKLLENLHNTQQHMPFSREESLKISSKSIHPILEKACKDISELINCDRVEIWLFNDEQTQLSLDIIYDCKNNSEMTAEIIKGNDAPRYFKSILSGEILALDDINHRPQISILHAELSKYCKRSSSLNIPIDLGWGIGGVLCCLSADRRIWTSIEKHVISLITDMMGLIIDRYHHIKAEEQIYKLANTDVLTGLDNQHSFYQKVTKRLREIPEYRRGVFIYFVIDQFSNIQGALGYDAGEQVLKNIAKRLKDVFTDAAVITRIGFDHFVIFTEISISEKRSTNSIIKLTESISRPMDVYGQEVYTTFSFGVSYYPDHVQYAQQGLQAAQTALNAAREKRSRKARGIYHLNMQGLMTENFRSEMNLRKALDEKQFELYYQPQVLCETGEVYGFEALIRWNHPEQGLIPPSYFIPLAESTGLIIPIGERVIREAFAQLSRWKENGYGHFTISINLSPSHFLHEELPVLLKNCTIESGISPTQLTLEVTENAGFEHYEFVKNRMIALNHLGFPISIDDFGTGYSAFVYLQHLPIQEIKIDQKFIRSLHINPRSIAVVQAIIQLGKMLHVKTVAEGVETIEEWNMLKKMGCNDLQGFYFGKPLSIGNINDLIQSASATEKLYLPLEANPPDNS